MAPPPAQDAGTEAWSGAAPPACQGSGSVQGTSVPHCIPAGTRGGRVARSIRGVSTTHATPHLRFLGRVDRTCRPACLSDGTKLARRRSFRQSGVGPPPEGSCPTVLPSLGQPPPGQPLLAVVPREVVDTTSGMMRKNPRCPGYPRNAPESDTGPCADPDTGPVCPRNEPTGRRPGPHVDMTNRQVEKTAPEQRLGSFHRPPRDTGDPPVLKTDIHRIRPDAGRGAG